MEQSSDLQYSEEALASRYLFYKEFNDINIFVEDEGKEYEYEEIFKRMFKGKYKIASILGVGGKIALENRFKEFGEEAINGNKKVVNIYIADGDFDRYIDREMVENEHFIYLKTYNIENYFIDEEACLTFVKGYLKKTDSEVRQKIRFENWKDTIINQASKLFLYYCFIKKYYPSIKSVDRGEYTFIEQKTGFERKEALYEYKTRLLELDPNLESKVQEVDNIYKSICGEDYFNLICGKFLFISLYCYIKSKLKNTFRASKEEFRWNMICNFDIEKLNYLKNRITALV